jgi:hypothetical protein
MCYSLQLEPGEELSHIYYSSLNFKDVMTTTARLPVKLGGRLNPVSIDMLHEGDSHKQY